MDFNGDFLMIPVSMLALMSSLLALPLVTVAGDPCSGYLPLDSNDMTRMLNYDTAPHNDNCDDDINPGEEVMRNKNRIDAVTETNNFSRVSRMSILSFICSGSGSMRYKPR